MGPQGLHFIGLQGMHLDFFIQETNAKPREKQTSKLAIFFISAPPWIAIFLYAKIF